MKFIVLNAITLLLLFSCGANDIVQLNSPDGAIQLTLSNRDRALTFKAVSQGELLISESPLGLLIQDLEYTRNITITNISRSSQDTTWQTVIGKNPSVRNQYNQLSFRVESVGSLSPVYEIEFRCYNDGFAYRYHFPAARKSDSLIISSELTRLQFTDDFIYWAYNGEHHNVGPVQRSEASDEEIRTPVVIKMQSGKYLGIHEAAIFDFAPFNLQPDSGKYSLQFTETPMNSVPPFSSSWRTFIIGEGPGDLVESDLLVNLNEPCKIEDTSWIQPGKSVWDWRVLGYKSPDGFIYDQSLESHLRFIDFASENNIQYLLIDADWYGSEFDATSDPTQSRSGVDIKKTMAYAKERDVGIILYLNDVGAKKFGLERVLRQFSEWGAAGVKYGFMQGSGAEKVRHTRRVAELCAKYQLIVDFHDNPVPPSGDRRTWPNLVTREFGHAQTDAKRSYQPVTAVTAPFVNMIAGPLDLTNGWFGLNNAHSREKVFEEIPGTVVAEVAKLIVVYTGLMVLPDSPEAYLEKADLFECIRKMPPMFDGFDVLDGEIGKFISVARRTGDEWFIGSLTNEDSRSHTINCDFLPDNVSYRATLYEDSKDSHYLSNKESYRISQVAVDNSTQLQIEMAAGGGHAIHLQPVQK